MKTGEFGKHPVGDDVQERFLLNTFPWERAIRHETARLRSMHTEASTSKQSD